MLMGGAVWAIKKGYGVKDDLDYIEERGRVEGAEPEHVSDMAKKRQYREMGTLGSGNHYLEVQVVSEVYDEQAALAMSLRRDDVIITVHCGSRGLGHQIGTDYLKSLANAAHRFKLPIRDRELVSAPIESPEGKRYFGAMNAGINCALANRQIITHLVREIFTEVFPEGHINMLYDISHNTCKVETHVINGKKKRLYVHRKGATRSFGPGQMDIPLDYPSYWPTCTHWRNDGDFILYLSRNRLRHAYRLRVCLPRRGKGYVTDSSQKEVAWQGRHSNPRGAGRHDTWTFIFRYCRRSTRLL